MHIGIIGGGQLGQMLGAAAKRLGIKCTFVDPSESPPASREGPVIQKAFDDPAALAELAANCDVITYEFENVPVQALLNIADRVPVYPPPDALRIAQDRLNEKQLFEQLDIPLPPYHAIDSPGDFQDAVTRLRLPLVLKTRRFGYDGKGQCVIRAVNDIAAAWDELGDHPLIAEAFVPFDYEVSVIGVRNPAGDVAIWPLTKNAHEQGILRTSLAPVADDELFEKASGYMRRLLSHLDYVGVLSLELFVTERELLANEFAPRVHNSGHWTIEGAATSQFTNHMLAISGQAPGSTACPGFAGMINLIGEIPDDTSTAAGPRVFLHDYGKAARPGRKLGHVTILADSAAERDELLQVVSKSVT
jgi:5-(carboxyamino)imidazole ribonucleotide synthase